MTRLITVEELKQDGFINQNLENEYLYSAIDEAQGIFLREIIGDSLYETLQNKLSEANINGVYQTLLDSYVKIYLKYKVLALLCVPLNFKIRNIGIAQQFSNEVNTTSLEDTKYIQNYYEGKADFYANRLTKFLQTNDIPEYKCSSNQITEPNELHPVSSIYLGNSKKRVFFGGSGSSGGGGGAVGDVVWGNIKGDITNQIDLQNELTIKVNRSELARVATSGSFNDLLDKPVIPTKTSELENDSGFLTEQTLKTINGESLVGTGNIEIGGGSTQVQSDWAETNTESVSYIKNKPSLATVATTGSYSDLSGTPSLSNVATSGNYDDLLNKPTIPNAQVNSDWNASSGISQILNKPTLSIVATSGSFNDLLDKPTIPTKTSELTNDSGFLTEHQPLKTINGESLVGTGNITIEGFSGDYNDLTNKPVIPTKTSELTNDSGFLTEQTLKTINGESLVGTGNIEIGGGSGRNVWYGNQAQFDAIPESELDQETDYYISGLIAWDDVAHPYIPTKVGDLQNDKDYTPLNQVRNEIVSSLKIYDKRVQYVSEEEYNTMEQAGSLRDGTTYFIEGEYVIPTKTSELENDSGFLTEHQPLKTINGESLVGTGNITIEGFSGDYNDLLNKPNFSTVATTGSFNDLLDKPTIPSNTVEMVVEFADGTSTTYNVYIQ